MTKIVALALIKESSYINGAVSAMDCSADECLIRLLVKERVSRVARIQKYSQFLFGQENDAQISGRALE